MQTQPSLFFPEVLKITFVKIIKILRVTQDQLANDTVLIPANSSVERIVAYEENKINVYEIIFSTIIDYDGSGKLPEGVYVIPEGSTVE